MDLLVTMFGGSASDACLVFNVAYWLQPRPFYAECVNVFHERSITIQKTVVHPPNSVDVTSSACQMSSDANPVMMSRDVTDVP